MTGLTAALTRPITRALTRALTGMGSSVAQITAGPAAVNNRDGTVTWTWTTDIATDSKAAYGTTSSLGTTVTDASEVTSHSLTATIATDGILHFQVGDIASTYTSDIGLCYCDAAHLDQFFSYPHFIDPALASVWAETPNHYNPAYGLSVELAKISTISGGSIWAINDAFESAMRPGIRFPRAFDEVEGTITTLDDGNVRYHRITAGNTDTARGWWNVTAAMAADLAMGKAIHFSYGGDANYKLWRKRSAVVTEVLGTTAPGSSVANPQTQTLSADIEAGDQMGWSAATFGTGGGGEVYIASLQIYDDSKTCVNPRTHFIPVTQVSRVSVLMAGSTAEGAWRVSPTGETVKFTGGPAHQAGDATNGSEYPAAHTFTKSGAAWTLDGGARTEPIVLTRDSTIYYDVSNPDIGDLQTVYRFYAYGLRSESHIESSVAWDYNPLYFAMLPFEAAAFATSGITTDGQVANTEEIARATIEGAGFVYFADGLEQANPAIIYALETPGGFSVCMYHGLTGSNIARRDTEHKGSNNFKHYAEVSPSSATNVSVDVQSYVEFWHDGPNGPVDSAPTLSATSCTVGADGRTILVVPVTKTRGITGNSGLTFNVGGSPIALDSTTNNADGTLTCVVALADKIVSTDVVTVDNATESLYDAHGIMMPAASGTAVVNHSEQ